MKKILSLLIVFNFVFALNIYEQIISATTQKVAEQKESELLFSYAFCYLEGYGVEKDEKTALVWMEEAGVQGSIDAQRYLVLHYKEKGDELKTFKWIKKVAEQGDLDAQILLAGCYLEGYGVEKDERTAAELIKKANEQSVIITPRFFSELYDASIEVEKHENIPINLFNNYIQAAEKGDVEAQFMVGAYYALGLGVTVDGLKALEWVMKAAEQGHIEAKNLLFTIYENYSNLADQGDIEAIYNLGSCYAVGMGVEKDKKQAFEWYKKAAVKGHAEAQYCLGQYYRKGTCVEKDIDIAVEWYRKSADYGNVKAQFNLGSCYAEGMGVEKDKKQAFEWYKKAAEQGYAIAQYTLGNYYYAGKGVEKNQQKAVNWYKRAAGQGHAVAQYNMGVIYSVGICVEKDQRKGEEWYLKAAEQGNKDAMKIFGW